MATAFKIDVGIQVPAGRSKYPFAEMAPGDSFFVAGPLGLLAARNAACMWAKRHGQKFTCRSVEGGLRVWRTA